MAKRKIMSNRLSKKVFRRGTKIHRKNGYAGNTVMRGGIRF